jgi:hypothetical protein
MQMQLKKSEESAFQSQTELDVLSQVLELKVDEATVALKARLAELEARAGGAPHPPATPGKAGRSEVTALEKQVRRLNQKVERATEALKAYATRAGLAAQRPKLTAEEAKQTLENLERSLHETAEELSSS